MKLDNVKELLKEARGRQRVLRKEIDRLRQMMRDAGGDPDAPEIDLTERNRQIYILWMEGNSFANIAKEYDKSVTTVSNVCHRIDYIVEKRNHPKFERYKALIKYKRKAELIKKRSQSK